MAFCNKCGTEVNPTSAFCTKCGTPVNVQNRETNPNNYQQNNPYQSPMMKSNINTNTIFTWSILNTIFCCLPLGIAGIVYSNKAKNATSDEEAQKILETAKTVCIIGTVVGFIVEVILILINVNS
jgi:uncharacterized membrane protein YvbJ